MKIPWAALGEYRRRRLIDYLLRDGEDYEEGREERDDYRAAVDALRSLPHIDEPSYGNEPAPHERQLLSRAELPAWVVLLEEDPFVESYFYATSSRRIVQMVFGFGDHGAVFCDKVVHLQGRGATRMTAEEVTEIPGCVLIAVGVEQIRRTRGGK